MNFLNNVAVDYPDTISFAAGRPYEGLFDVDGGLAAIDRYISHRADMLGIASERVRADLGQYQRTSGLIGDLIARQLANDEGIIVDPDDVLVTVGAQEAMTILLLGLFDPARDVLLCSLWCSTNPIAAGLARCSVGSARGR